MTQSMVFREMSSSLSSSDSSESDDEMRSRLLAVCVTTDMIKESNKKMSKIKDDLIKVGPYEDIELSKKQYQMLGKLIMQLSEDSFEFKEPKKKTNKRLADQERIFEECPNLRLISSGAIIDLTDAPSQKKKRRKESKRELNEKMAAIASMAVTFEQIKTMV